MHYLNSYNFCLVVNFRHLLLHVCVLVNHTLISWSVYMTSTFRTFAHRVLTPSLLALTLMLILLSINLLQIITHNRNGQYFISKSYTHPQWKLTMWTHFMLKVEVAEQQVATVRLLRQSLLHLHRIQWHVHHNNYKNNNHQVNIYRKICRKRVNYVL